MLLNNNIYFYFLYICILYIHICKHMFFHIIDDFIQNENKILQTFFVCERVLGSR